MADDERAVLDSRVLAERRLDSLWQDHAPAVLRYARRRVFDAEVDEVVAETFVVAWRRIEDVPEFALPWLLGVARGVSANVRRAARRRDDLTQRLVAQPEGFTAMPDVRSDADEDLPAAITLALHRLSAKDRELLTLMAWDGLDRDQAAEALGCSRGTLAVRLHRARRRLRAELDCDTDHHRAGAVADSPPPRTQPATAEASP